MSAGLVPSPVLTSTSSPSNAIAREATRLLNQSTADTKYDPIPEKRVEEPFQNYASSISITLGIFGVALVALGIFAKK